MRAILRDEFVVAECSVYKPYPMQVKQNDLQQTQAKRFKKGSKMNMHLATVAANKPRSAYVQAAAMSGLSNTRATVSVALNLEKNPEKYTDAIHAGRVVVQQIQNVIQERVEGELTPEKAEEQKEEIYEDNTKAVAAYVANEVLKAEEENEYTYSEMAQGVATFGVKAAGLAVAMPFAMVGIVGIFGYQAATGQLHAQQQQQIQQLHEQFLLPEPHEALNQHLGPNVLNHGFEHNPYDEQLVPNNAWNHDPEL